MAGSSKWAWSKSTGIKVMLVIDTAFFLLELIAGFLAHSLALTADAFHMLNDIISLVIGLWAVVAAQKETTDEFTFGWVRAEILGAFFNAVFLIALCVSIILEALTRFVEPPDINNPKLILIVGCAGLFSNLLGFFVLGGHGHSHDDEGEDGHDHAHAHGQDHAHDHDHAHDIEEGRPVRDIHTEYVDEDGAVNDILPEVVVRRASGAADRSVTDSPETARRIRFGAETASRDESNTRGSRAPGQARGRGRRQSSKSGHSRFASIEDMSIHPASFRQDTIAASLAASSNTPGQTAESDTSEESPFADSETEVNEASPLLKGAKGNNGTIDNKSHGSHPISASRKHRSRRDSSIHDGHNHTLPRKPGSKASGHNHADMGMNAMMLHVLGDALGNVGVIITALIIWLTDWLGKSYADPTVSLLITAIILKTSVPLTLATARVLLQATPENISIQEIRQDIERLPGVVSCHHIHVWQLSDTKIVASLHLQVSFPINTHSGEKYMQLAKRARKCLHGYGIHSATIQPEFCLDQDHQHGGDAAALTLDGATNGPSDNACLLECVDDCKAQGCCTGQDTSSKASSTRRGSDSSHGGTSAPRQQS
ncbi:Zinc/cadmium resistance protein [Tolypocladium ophioglossoides CBS 100239]|uniref:Zinc/cadmium resistance protein n=1 Tax=Tolypocladium ophioglossoides (strain CBS 100239) TaxID=1163406 RepID=A0A0L0NC41_TOLOC|nr:Zinc/cadmium resistance protein [Tolypocladium ophioglossoides CBS 100239]